MKDSAECWEWARTRDWRVTFRLGIRLIHSGFLLSSACQRHSALSLQNDLHCFLVHGVENDHYPTAPSV